MRSLLTVATLLVGAGLLWLVVIWPSWSGPETDHAPPARSALAGEPAAPPPPPAAQARPEEAAPPAAPQPSAAAPREAPATAPPEARPEGEADVFDEVRGPLDELQRRFEHEPRDSAASDAESTIRAAFEPEQAHGELLRSVLCRATVCRIELRWTASKLGNYVAAMGRLSVRFAPEFASTAAGPEAGQQNRSVELYVERKP